MLLVLADHANDEGGSCFPSIETIAKRARQCARNVTYNLRRLEKLDEVRVLAAGRGRISTRYQIQVQKLRGENFAPHTGNCISEVKPVAPQRCSRLHPNSHITVRKPSSQRYARPNGNALAEVTTNVW